jgi:hypothetical protein
MRRTPYQIDGKRYETLKDLAEAYGFSYGSLAVTLQKNGFSCRFKGHQIARIEKEKKPVNQETPKLRPVVKSPKKKKADKKLFGREPLMKTIKTDLISSEWRG